MIDMDQPTLFDENASRMEAEKIVLFALGDFQSRKKVLVDRELALDRLRGAFKRACERFGRAEMADEEIAGMLEKLGARVTELPPFVAKHPYRVTVSRDLADQAAAAYLYMRKLEEA